MLPCASGGGAAATTQEPAFQASVSRRFEQLRASAWSDAAVGGAVKQVGADVHDAALRTFSK